MLLMFLILVPILAWRWSTRHRDDRRWRITGAAFGVIVGPLCIGLYAIYPIFPPGGMLGLYASLIHSIPGYEITTIVGLVEGKPKPIDAVDQLWIAGVNAIVWGAAYGTLGWLIDRRRMRKNVRTANPAREGSAPVIKKDAS